VNKGFLDGVASILSGTEHSEQTCVQTISVAIDEFAERFRGSCPALPDQLSVGRIHWGYR
jgi:hypothetical protein